MAAALLDRRVVAKTADVLEGWLWNVFEAQVLHQLDPQDRYWLRFEEGTVWVQPTFGLEPLGGGPTAVM